MNNTIILGAGLTGLSSAYHLKKDYKLFEKEPLPGGLCRSIVSNGFTFDLTGHLLHVHDEYTKTLVKHLLHKNIHELKRNSWIYSKRTFTRYPFQAHTYGLPKKVIKECLSDFFAAQAKLKRFKKPSRSFEDWILRHFGRGIARHFMVPYNEKLWLRSLSELTIEWLDEFVPQPSVEEVLRGSLTNSETSLGYNKSFLYPKKGGIQSLINSFLPYIDQPHYNSEALRIRWYDRRVELAGKGPIMYDRLISTIPLPVLINRMHRVPADVIDAARSLKWISVLCINLGVKRAQWTDKTWIYFPEKENPFYRIGFHSNFSKHMVPRGCSSMYVEIAHRPEKKPDLQKILSDTIQGIRRTEIVRHEDQIIKINVVPLPYAYVIYDFNRTPAVDLIQSFLSKHGIISTGRYGGWKYSYMEEAILDGKKAAEQILS
ncbi:MAG: FAD-dependent oxidoreductase [bacterium]